MTGPAKCRRSLEFQAAQSVTTHRPRVSWQRPERNSTHIQAPSSARLIPSPYSPPLAPARNGQHENDDHSQDVQYRHIKSPEFPRRRFHPGNAHTLSDRIAPLLLALVTVSPSKLTSETA